MKKTIILLLLSLIPLISCGSSGEKVIKDYKVYLPCAIIKAEPGGEGFIVIKADIPKGSHIYANPKGPGTGKPTHITVAPVNGIDFQATRYLEPKRFVNPGEKNHVFGYSGETTFFIPFSIKSTTAAGEYPITVSYSSLICTDKECVPGDETLKMAIHVVKGPIENLLNDKLKPIFATAKPAEGEGALTEIYSKDSPASDKVAPLLAVPAFKMDGIMSIQGGTLEGIQFTPLFHEKGVTGIIQAILFGIIAGMILNVMPCVLPVISLKLLALVKQAEMNRRESALSGLAFSGGILLSFMALALLAAFFGYNWGGLFQHQIFLTVMTALVFALGLSMLGVFKLIPAGFSGKAASSKVANPYLDSFIKGLLATLLATPCSGPFLGGTLAWALTQPPLTIFLIFMSVGVGMALPYLLLAINPSLTRLVPKPGNWMTYLETGMGFVLMFTTVYLLSIFEPDAVIQVLIFLAFLGVAFWQYGSFGSPLNSKPVRNISLAALILITAMGYGVSFHLMKDDPKPKEIAAETFSDALMIKNRDSGKISVVKFTADWCPNCKLVEKTSLYTAKVTAKMKESGAVLVTADITRKHPEAEKLLAKLGSKSIPFLAVFPAGARFTSPICLRDIYSESDVLKALEEAKK